MSRGEFVAAEDWCFIRFPVEAIHQLRRHGRRRGMSVGVTARTIVATILEAGVAEQVLDRATAQDRVAICTTCDRRAGDATTRSCSAANCGLAARRIA